MNVLISVVISITVLIAAFGQLQRIDFFPGVQMYLYEIPLACSVLCLMVIYKKKPFLSIPLHELSRATKWLLVYFSALLVITFFWFSPFYNGVAVLYWLRLVCYLLFIIYFYYHCLQQRYMPWVLFTTAGIYFLLLVGGAILQYFYYPDLRNLFYAGWDPHYYRLFGQFLEPVIAGSLYGISVVFLVTTTYFPQYVSKFLSVFFSLFILATFSRAIWVAVGIAAFFYILKNGYNYIKIGMIALIIAVGIFVLLPKPSGEGVNMLRTSTILSRNIDYQEGIAIWKMSPVFGIGYNHLPAVKKQPVLSNTIPNHAAGSLHSSFLIIVATGGGVGLLFFLNWLNHLKKRSSFLKYAVIFLSVGSLFDNILLHPFILLSIGIFGGFSLIPLSDTSVSTRFSPHLSHHPERES